MKGILFKPDMIRAIMEDRKTVTRRLSELDEINEHPDEWVYQGCDLVLHHYYFYSRAYVEHKDGDAHMITVKPRYLPGETVYIKEAWNTMFIYDVLKPSELKQVVHPIGYFDTDWGLLTGCADDKGRNRSPLFMPECAARYHVKLSIVPQRLQDITEEDAKSEGVNCSIAGIIPSTYRDCYAQLWDSINKKNIWESKPWVWRIEFKKVDRLLH
jgi:hypothetical protein